MHSADTGKLSLRISVFWKWSNLLYSCPWFVVGGLRDCFSLQNRSCNDRKIERIFAVRI